jgi:2-keto-4-pentenoate hydratase/2-oxohepta-3-ene-1,7-dioic acid hydratase in catechol pathway
MRFAVYVLNGHRGLAVDSAEGFRGLFQYERGYPGDLDHLIASQADLSAAASALQAGQPISLETARLLPPFPDPGKIICIGLNYVDHSAEVGMALPQYPVVFARFSSSLIGHLSPVVMPRQSIQLDYEGELVAVIGKSGRNISREEALDYVAGYSLFNDITVRDYQLRTSQWTVGKNFDGTGAFGPFFVPSDELPPGCKGLQLTTRLNGRTVQRAAIADMIFDVEALIASLSEAFTLSAGDIIVTGTPGGIGMSHSPPLWMKPGDTCEVEVPGLGVLRNSIVDASPRED